MLSGRLGAEGIQKGGCMRNLTLTFAFGRKGKAHLAATVATAALGCVVAPMAHAQTSSAAVSATADDMSAVGDIVVTAQRREERASKVPLSITATSGNTLERLNVRTGEQLATVTPGLSFANTGPIPTFSIRGITLNDYGSSNESPIAYYVDDVYLAAPNSAVGQMFDVGRVEVLRGPQGTLFGRNATGGLVHVISNKPTKDFEGDASIQYGSYNQVIANVAMGGPISDQVRIRGAVYYNRDDGYQKNVTTNTRLAKTNTVAGRLLIDADLSSTLSSELNIHASYQNNISPGLYNRGLFDPNSGAPCSTSDRLANACASPSPFLFRNPDPKPTRVFSDIAKPKNRYTAVGVSETLKYSGESFNLTSISAFEYGDKNFEDDADGTPAPLLLEHFAAKRSQFTQELRASGDIGNMRWVGGGYFYYERLTDGFASVPQLIPLFGVYGSQNEYNGSTRSGALFGQIDYQIVPELTVTLGGRYTAETKKLTITDDFSNPTYIDNVRTHEEKFTWKAGIAWRFVPDWMTYASVSTGFKSPASNTSIVVQGGAVATKPETNTNYEVGLKGEAFDRRLQLSTALFYVDYRNFQKTAVNPSSGNVVSRLLNAKAAKIYGADIEINATPVDHLTLNVSANYLHTKIDAPGLFNGAFPLDGSSVAFSPKLTIKGYGRYDWDLGSSGILSPYLSFSYRSHSESTPALNPLTRIPGYGLLAVGVQYAFPKSNVTLDVFADNVTNKGYFTYRFNLFGYNPSQWGRPRTFGVRLATKL